MAALKKNLAKIRTLAKGAKIIPVIKADAYGHGVHLAAKALRAPGVDLPAVMYMQEGYDLRAAGFRGPILILSCPPAAELRDALQGAMIPTVSRRSQAKDVARASRRIKARCRMAVEVDVGMARLGCKMSDLAGILSELSPHGGSSNLKFGGVFAHFPRADMALEETRRAGHEFRAGILAAGLGQGPSHVSNSAALVKLGSFGLTHVRPGLAIYGVDPFPTRKKKFWPVLSLRSKIQLVRKVKQGTWVSYGKRFRAKKDMTLAVIGAGYADGIPRSLTGRGKVLVKGHRVSLVGMVCMDMVLCDISRLGGVRPGHEAIFIGQSGKERITVEDVARWAQTIPYEILTGLGGRVARIAAP